MSDTRETRPRPVEIKFLVDEADGRRLRAWLRANLEADPRGHGACLDEHHVTSLYFDTPDLDVFHRRGAHAQARYRIRRRDEDDAAVLEHKARADGRVARRRTRVSLADLERLGRHAPDAWAGSWFDDLLAAHALGPVCQISYVRTARQLVDSAGEVARVTIDTAVQAMPASGIGFAAGRGVVVLPHQEVLTLKSRAHLPAALKRIIETFGLVPRKLSKYRLSLDAIVAPGLSGQAARTTEVGLHG